MRLIKLSDSLVDITRCQITRNGNVISIEPKVMDVLNILCEQSGEVVSQQKLHEELWPGTTFSSSSIQRCIALLRKSLGEKATGSSIIITHPKRGYSIGVPILFKPSNSKAPITFLKKMKVLLALLCSFCLLVVLIFSLRINWPTDTSFPALTPLTSNSHNEYFPTYSYSGIYIAFVRELASGQQQILIKDLTTEQEIAVSGSFSNLKTINWAYQDNGLTVVSEVGGKDKIEIIAFNPITQKVTQQALTIFTSTDKIVSRVEWLSETDIIFVVKTDESTFSILQYNLVQRKKILIHQYADNEVYLIDIALSPDRTELAISLGEKGNLYTLDLLDLLSKKLKQLTTLENGIHSISWHPSGESILVSSREKLLSISLAGDIEQIPISNYKMIKSASYSKHADQVVMELGNYDIDIVELKINKKPNSSKVVNTSALDLFPQYSPLDEQFVYQTNRRGFFQLIVNKVGREYVLFLNPQHEEFYGFTWSPDGEVIALATAHNLYLFDMASPKEFSIIKLEHKIYIRDWFNQDDALLVNVIVEKKSMPAKFHLGTGIVEEFAAISVSCSAIDEKDNIYFNYNNQIYKVDNNKQRSTLWHPESGDIENIMIAKNHLIAQVNHEGVSNYWQIELNTGNAKPIFESVATDLTISDVTPNGNSFLFYTSFQVNKELIILDMAN